MDGSQKRAGLISMSPSQTPRSGGKSGKDLRSNDSNGNSNSKHDRDRGVNVQVILRCKPLSEDEMRANTPVVIYCNEHRREVSAIQSIANKQIDRIFTFDKVFGPASQQKDLFDQAVSPIVNEVLEGYNCTIFAYGQTGTGKTYTMEGGGGGGMKTKNGEFSSDAGVILRAVQQIFRLLEAQKAEYSMKVTFLELYNEDITDLLAPDESKSSDEKPKKSIALMEDGKGGVFARGLEEEVVYSASEIYRILDRGSSKRRTAETLLNKQSSRSHSVFSITILIKECTPLGEELIKCGKLNLVDLAGSENILRSGAREARAREAGEVNKSLLTLGRVINALVEHSCHIPYRDSKLTRLLRDSLGGKTKTCIIATISPSIHCLEETLSTLDYAHRAKNIKNKPEVNQKMMKSELIKDLYSEIDRLKQEVYAAREKNGIYIPHDRYLHVEAEKKAMVDKMEQLELHLESKDEQLAGIQDLYKSQKVLNAELSEKFQRMQRKLEDTEHALFGLEQRYVLANSKIKEKEYLISNLLNSEKGLVEHAYELRSELEDAAADVSGLFCKIERKDKIEDGNRILVQRFRGQLSHQLDLLHRTVSTSVMQQENQLKEMEEDIQSFISTKAKATEELRGLVAKLEYMYGSGIKALDDLSSELNEKSESALGELMSQVLLHYSSLEAHCKGIAQEADQVLNELQSSFYKQEDKLALFAQQQHEGHLRSVETTHDISKITTNFFHILDGHASKLSMVLEESQTIQEHQLCELEKKFEECASNEERQLLEKVAEMLASSTATKKNVVQAAVHRLRESATKRTSSVRKEMSNAFDFASSAKEQWMLFMEEAENHYRDDTDAVETGRCSLEEGFQLCKAKARMGSQQLENARNSLISLGKGNVALVDSIVRSGMEANQLLRARLSSAASTALEDANKDLLSSIDCSLKLDHDEHWNLNSLVIPCREELRILQSGHYRKTTEIAENAAKYLEEEYMVDEPSCSTPTRRSIDLQSVTTVDELRTPALEELQKSFWEVKSTSKQVNGELEHLYPSYECRSTDSEDSRVPLTTLN